MVTEAIKTEVAEWIDPDVIAEALLEDLKEDGFQPTVENAQKLWLDILENELHQAIRSTLNHSPAFGN